MSKLQLVIGASLVAALCGAPSSARAFPDEPASLDENPDGSHDARFHLLVDLATHFGKLEGAKILTVSPLVAARLQFTEHVLLELQWGTSFQRIKRDNDSTDSAFRFGNPYAAVHYQAHKRDLSYRVGVGLTVPLATLPDDPNDNFIAQAAYGFAAATRGYWHYWLWDPHAIGLIVPFRVERTKPSGFLWGVELDAGAMVSIDDKNEDTNIIVQVASELGYQANEMIRVGGRFALVIIPKLQGEETQLSVEPYARFGSANQFFSVRLLVNIDRPRGFGFDQNKVWGLRLGGGAAF